MLYIYQLLKQNIFSVQAATKNGAHISFEHDNCQLIDSNVAVFNITHYLKNIVSARNATYDLHTWHKVFGHCDESDIKKLPNVALGRIIYLSVEPRIEPGIFRFQSKVLATPLPSLRSSSTFLLLSLTLLFSLSLSLCASSFIPLPPSFLLLLLLLAEKKWRQKKNESVFIHVTLPIIPQFFPLMGWRWIIETAVSIFLFFHPVMTVFLPSYQITDLHARHKRTLFCRELPLVSLSCPHPT